MTEPCPNCGGPLQAMPAAPGCMLGDDCTHGCPACGWHFAPTEQRTFTVRYGLPRYQVRQHLELSGIEYAEDKRTLESVFTVSVTDLQWEAINEYAEKVKG